MSGQEPLQVKIVEARGCIERNLPYVAVVASVVAIAIAVWQGWETRNHNKMTVKPRIDFEYHLVKKQKVAGLYIASSGFGPAVISKVEIYIDGIKEKDWSSVIRKIKAETISPWKQTSPRWTEFGEGTYLERGNQWALLETDQENIRDWQTHKNLYHSRLCVKIEYCSIYEECFIVSTPFGRCNP